MSAFLHVPISLFYNTEVSGYGLENKTLDDLAARVLACEDNDSCISLIEQWLLSQVAINFTSKREADMDRIAAVVRQMYVTPNGRFPNWHPSPVWARSSLNACSLQLSG